jgi:hypothetical protein
MPHSLTLQINLENFNFLKPYKKGSLSYEQENIIQILKDISDQLSKLKDANFIEFTAKNDAEISRGAFYAITKSLQEKSHQQKICLEDLQAVFEKDFQIHDKQALSFITLCLVEPIWLPGSLSAIVSLLLSTSYSCSNESFKSLKADIDIDNNNQIIFHLDLPIKTFNDKDILSIGSTKIYFSIDRSMQVKLLPIDIQFDFPNKQESKQFQQKLAKNFKGWLLHQHESDYIPIKLEKWRAIQMDFWVFSTLIGFLVGLSVMVSCIVLSLTPVSPLLLPPLGLALGLCLASVMNTYAQINIKKEQNKSQRPIHLFNKKPTPNTVFFNPSAPLNPLVTTETQFMVR